MLATTTIAPVLLKTPLMAVGNFTVFYNKNRPEGRFLSLQNKDGSVFCRTLWTRAFSFHPFRPFRHLNSAGGKSFLHTFALGFPGGFIFRRHFRSFAFLEIAVRLFHFALRATLGFQTGLLRISQISHRSAAKAFRLWAARAIVRVDRHRQCQQQGGNKCFLHFDLLSLFVICCRCLPDAGRVYRTNPGFSRISGRCSGSLRKWPPRPPSRGPPIISGRGPPCGPNPKGRGL